MKILQVDGSVSKGVTYAVGRAYRHLLGGLAWNGMNIMQGCESGDPAAFQACAGFISYKVVLPLL